MKLLPMPLPAGRFPTKPQTAGVEGGVCGASGGGSAALDLDLPDPFRYQERRWCANCGGEQTFVPVDRFPFGWRGYCMGCEDVVYAMDTRTAEACA